jgi:hypothetical protein
MMVRDLGSSLAPRLWDGKPVVSAAQILHPHTDYAHRYWAASLLELPCETEHLVVDATAGNGHDSLELARSLARAGGGRLCVCDVQSVAIERSQERLKSSLKSTDVAENWDLHCSNAMSWRATMMPQEDPSAAAAVPSERRAVVDIEWHVCDHAAFLEALAPSTASLIVFNLGYLPGGEKSIVTTGEGTVRALIAAQRAVRAGGAVSVTVYPGHDEGKREEGMVLEHAASLPQGEWSVYHHQWLNQRSKRTGIRAPGLVLLQRMNEGC